jgi:ATP-dependent helicase/nuclease subunit A
MMDDATRDQNLAADPRFSTWLSANAGSGKTRVLTDRVARLLLAGTEPQNILCLTYTKAAASEMQNRLFERLGKWAMLEDGALRQELIALGETPPASLSRARTLFARAVEAPGGLKIQTIHSFCSAVLRQFPLEARVSPQFKELDEQAQKALLETVLDDFAEAGHPALAAVARIHSGETLTDLAMSVAKNRERFTPPRSRDDIFRLFGAPPSLSARDVIDTGLRDDDLAFLKSIAPILKASSSRDASLGDTLAALPDAATLDVLGKLENALLYGESAKAGPFTAKVGNIPTKGLREGAFQPYLDRFNSIMEQVEEARRLRLVFEAASKSAALHDFANAFLPAYRAARENAGALDFDDLILKTGTLLTTRSLEWVLYRLDGGIEHILVDEAQDTAPVQWEVIDALAREITSGEGARGERTLFVVGDKKQSIYSFQGADARVFDKMKETFSDRLSNGPKLEIRELLFSFRSSSAILQGVDSVFRGDAGRGLGHSIQHRAFKATLPGRVDLWPLLPSPDKADKPNWYDPVDLRADNDPRVVLADHIAAKIDEMIKTETIVDKNGVSRRVTAGDVLILVQRRSELFDQIIRACKAAKLPVAGADRLKIAGELAVKDLLALLSFLALQEDDLSLAAALRSPLFGWSEKALYDLAHNRKQGYLWAELRDRKADFPDTFRILDELRAQVDFLRPYELLELILTRYDGRRKLLARLGPEAEDGIDELLNQAIHHERDDVPGLTAFLTRAHSEDTEIKRPSDNSGDLIRVMTVHGAKGLEAPIVILPDTVRAERQGRDPILLTEDGVPTWRVSRNDAPDSLARARELAESADREERQRLLYVAMTRAQCWLIVCGILSSQSTENWHTDVEEGMRLLSPQPIETPTGEGLRVSHGEWPTDGMAILPENETDKGILPDFLSEPVMAPDMKQRLLSPSELGGAKVSGGGAKSEEAALRHGRQVHRLLEFLPRTGDDPESARRVLASGEDPAEEGELGSLLAEARQAIARHPQLFDGAALAEVDATAMLPTLDQRISGTIDRLLVTPDLVTAVDFKTNAIVPDRPEDVPEGILRQMGAYLEALEQIFPGRRVELVILWTANASLLALPHGIVRDALARTTTS